MSGCRVEIVESEDTDEDAGDGGVCDGLGRWKVRVRLQCGCLRPICMRRLESHIVADGCMYSGGFDFYVCGMYEPTIARAVRATMIDAAV